MNRAEKDQARVEPPEALRARLQFDDARLMAECDIHLHRTGGPGGQHRNKVETAVRLVHRPSGITVTAGETRSQHENKATAIRRLREAIATEIRVPLPAAVIWPESVRIQNGRLRVNEANAGLPETIATVLDALSDARGNLSEAAVRIGVTSSSVTKFLFAHPRAWTAAQGIRAAYSLGPLRH